jgi:hypothetical protein
MRRVYRSLSVPKTRRRAICQRGVWPFRVVRTAAVRTSASPSVAHASHEGLNDRNGSCSVIRCSPSMNFVGSPQGSRGSAANFRPENPCSAPESRSPGTGPHSGDCGARRGFCGGVGFREGSRGVPRAAPDLALRLASQEPGDEEQDDAD